MYTSIQEIVEGIIDGINTIRTVEWLDVVVYVIRRRRRPRRSLRLLHNTKPPRAAAAATAHSRTSSQFGHSVSQLNFIRTTCYYAYCSLFVFFFSLNR